MAVSSQQTYPADSQQSYPVPPSSTSASSGGGGVEANLGILEYPGSQSELGGVLSNGGSVA